MVGRNVLGRKRKKMRSTSISFEKTGNVTLTVVMSAVKNKAFCEKQKRLPHQYDGGFVIRIQFAFV